MARLSPTSFKQLLSTSDEELSENSVDCIPQGHEIISPYSSVETKTTITQFIPDTYYTPTARQLTLQERREKKNIDTSFPSLNAETLQEDSREGILCDLNTCSLFCGWSCTHLKQNLNSSLLQGVVKIVSYNILAQRLVSTNRYPHCPMFALVESYRCSLLKQELDDAAPDIIALQEVSVDVFEKPDLLGSWLRSEKKYAGNHVVITDADGRPRCDSNDPLVNKNSAYMSKRINYVTSDLGEKNTFYSDIIYSDENSQPRTRSEMEGVCIFYLEDRFDFYEAVPIRFNEIAAADEHLTQRERRRLQVSSHNVALISVLRDRIIPDMIYIICTVHLIWQRTECQLWQIHHVLREMEKLKLKYESSLFSSKEFPLKVSLILTGDFNSDANAPPMRYAVSGVPPPESDVMRYWKLPEGDNGIEHSEENKCSVILDNDSGMEGINQQGELKRKRYRITDSIEHSLLFSDCYATYRERYPRYVSAVTPSSNGEGGVLDHVLVDEQHVVCTSVVRLSVHTELPTKDCPSDHRPVGVTIVPRTSLT